MDLKSFAAIHIPVLERDAARHNLILTLVPAALARPASNLQFWSLGSAGACAIQSPEYPVVLGDLSEVECHALAEELRDMDYPGVVGPDTTAMWFSDGARKLGREFQEPMPQRIHTINGLPRYPVCDGGARPVDARDASLFADWMIAFMREATPHDPLPDREQLENMAGKASRWFWTVENKPVSMAGITRQAASLVNIGGVYTPPELRGRGYAGSVTAAIIDQAFAEGKTTVCLYTDLRNPFSNRCYQKIDFTPVCDSMHYPVAAERV